jgi:XTP/dITP diphosphohydrolase
MTKHSIVLATRNKHKVEEINHILKNADVEVLSLNDFKNVPEVVEDGETLRENAVKKACVVAKATKSWALADDTGLEVDYLARAPGVYSARFAGPGCSYKDNNVKLLKLMKGVPGKERTARFRCVIAVCNPNGDVITVDGSIEGVIMDMEKGKKGFGYDPVFYVPAYKKTFAELDLAIKNRISHRGKAVRKARKLIEQLQKNHKI